MTTPTAALAALVGKWRGKSEQAAPRGIGFVTEHCLGQSAAYEACADELEAALAALPASGWVPVGERLPENWEHVDVYPDPRDDTYSYCALADGGTNGVKAGRWYHNDREGYDIEIHPTHWRELPEPPSAPTPGEPK